MQTKTLMGGVLICVLLMATAVPAAESAKNSAIQPNEENKLEKVTLSFSQPIIKNENEYISIALNEANSFLMKQGKPKLPSYTKTLTFPFGTKIKSVTVTPQNIQMQTISNNLQPTPQYGIVGQDILIQEEKPLYYGTEIYPSTSFEYEVGCGRYDGALRILVNVQIYPIRYYPTENIIEYAQGANIVVEYQPSTQPQTPSRDRYQLIVIGPAQYSSQCAPLITHKIDKGITSKFISVEDIYAGTYFNATGRDNQEKIKYFIKNALESWSTESVLLVGGESVLPARDTHVHLADYPEDNNEIFASDLYYADIYNKTGAFCSWDSNKNNIFGEYNWSGQIDEVDLHPDVYLGRLPATNSSQVLACVDKIIAYETNPGYQQNWFTNLTLVGGDSFPDAGAINEGEYANQKVADVMTGFIPTKLWVSNRKLTGLAPTGVANIKSALKKGCGFVDFNGHGGLTIWATHPHDNFAVWVPTPAGGIRANDVYTLSNGDKQPIVTVEACSTADFAKTENCFNWLFFCNSHGGAIGTFGCAGLGYGLYGTDTTMGLLGKMGLDTYRAYKTDGAVSFGEMWSQALNRYISAGMADVDYKTVEEWQPFGDPTLAIGEKSNPPAKPTTPSGNASGKAREAYTYMSSATDPDDDQVYLMFDWGDGTTSGWVGPFASGATGSATHSWLIRGTYQIKVVAKDAHGKLSVWSDPLPVSMPLINGYSFDQPLLPFLQWLLARFPNAFPILRHMLGY